MIIDDELNRLLVNPLPPGVRMHVVIGNPPPFLHPALPQPGWTRSPMSLNCIMLYSRSVSYYMDRETKNIDCRFVYEQMFCVDYKLAVLAPAY